MCGNGWLAACVVASLAAAGCIDRSRDLRLPVPARPHHRAVLFDQFFVEPKQYRGMLVRVSGYLVDDPLSYARLYPSQDAASRDFGARDGEVAEVFTPSQAILVDVEPNLARACDRRHVIVYGTADALFAHNREGIRAMTALEGCASEADGM